MSSAAVLTVSGTASIREKIALPGGGVLTVKVVTSDGEVLGAAAVAAGDGPTEWEVTVDAIFAPDPQSLRLWAMLRTDVGVWGTPELVSMRDELVLSQVDG